MKNKCPKTAAYVISLALAAVNSTCPFASSNMMVVNAAEANSKKSEIVSESKSDLVQGENETYYDEETKTLHLKGCVINGGLETGVILPLGVDGNEVKHLVADKGTILPEDCCDFCFNLPFLESIDLKNADTSNVTDMSYMFVGAGDEDDYYCTLDLSNFDTSNVTNMHGIFLFRNFDEIVLNDFDTSKVTDMSNMFAYSNAASFFDNCRLDTSKVTDMSKMFDQAFIGEFDLSCLDTSNVTDMSGMFYGVESDSPDLKSLDTSNVTDMSDMFSYAYVESLDLNGLDTSSVTDMSGMFNGAYVSSLDMSSLDTSNVTDMSSMFSMSRINSLDISGFDTSNVTDMSSMFCQCEIPSLDLSNFDTSSVTDMSSMFSFAHIDSFDISSFDTSNVTNMNCMFAGAGDIEDYFYYCLPDLSNFDTSNVTNMEGMFLQCSASSLDLSSFDTSNVTNMSEMFSGCFSLVNVIVGDNWSIESVTDNEDMFCDCVNLKDSVIELINSQIIYSSGDANCDKDVDMSDAVLIMQSLANPNKYGLNGTDEHHITEEGINCADVDENGNGITVSDALKIQRYLLGQEEF